jgi:2-dehydro-3-deoxy-D-arabinonate dehydratase
MNLIKYVSKSGEITVGQLDGERVIPLDLSASPFRTLADLLEDDDLPRTARALLDPRRETTAAAVTLLAPIDQQEVWAAGVTYQRSQAARMEESEAAASCYDRVYSSPRPELFIKAMPHRVAGPGMPLRIRADSAWNVPEPEVTLVLNSRLKLVGFTAGNDMSSRDIEGENPLYLPQAKVYDACCGLGPGVTLASAMPPPESIHIELVVRRGGEVAFSGATSVARMARSFDELIEWLGRDNSFPNGVFLLTGTGVVPDRDFTLQPGDLVSVSIDGIGTLTNPIVQGKNP